MSSAVPAAVASLVAVVAGAVSAVDVFDGPPTTADYPDWIGVAYDPRGGDVITAARTWSQIGAQRFEEQFDIVCTLGCDTGDLDGMGQRARAYALLDTVSAAIAADYTLGGTVRVAHVSDHALVTDVDENGLSESLRFTVNVHTRING